MDLIDIPLTKIDPGSIAGLILPIEIINPENGLSLKTYGLIDTGADDCAIPGVYANRLGHNLTRGEEKEINTGNGITKAYKHTTEILIYHPNEPGKAVYDLRDVIIDFMPNLNVTLLGVLNFLQNFYLMLKYPENLFSITKRKFQ